MTRRPRLTLVKPVRFAPEEWDKIEAKADEIGLPPSVYVRRTTLGYRLSGRIRGRVVYSLCRIGNNLNQLARVANATGQIRQVRRLEEVLEEILDVVRELA